jgi:hypothetical protein
VSASSVVTALLVMRLYVEPMDVVVVEVDRDGRVRLETDEWIAPTLQEKRAILYGAQQELAELIVVVDVLVSGAVDGGCFSKSSIAAANVSTSSSVV